MHETASTVDPVRSGPVRSALTAVPLPAARARSRNGSEDSLSLSALQAEFSGGLRQLRCILSPSYLQAVAEATELLVECLRAGNKVLLCGNGGSAADAQHIAAELVGRYKIERPGLAAISLTSDTSVLTAWSNDYEFDAVFARQVQALCRPGDVVWGLSTSGCSSNIVRAMKAAQATGAHSIGLLGRDGGDLESLCDVSMVVRLQDTARIQEAHRMTYHVMCDAIDHAFAV